jgi:nicotinate phosphoribosyltransferase
MVSADFEIRRSVLVGETADVYLQRTLTILRNEGVNPVVTLEFSPQRPGVFCGITEARGLLARVLPESGSEVWALEEGDLVEADEVALRVKAPYGSVGLYETAISGILSQSTGYATAARQCVDAANGTPVVALGARHVHPDVAGILGYCAIVGGCVSCSTIQGARLAGITPAGNMPHSLSLLMGGTVQAMEAFDQEVPRVGLVDTFRDEAEEALAVARSLREKLRGIRMNTPSARGGVTPDLVKEVRARLDLSGFRHVEIMVSGGFTPDRISSFVEAGAPVNTFGIGAYIAAFGPNTFNVDIHEVDGRPIARRGRIPGITNNPRLGRVM